MTGHWGLFNINLGTLTDLYEIAEREIHLGSFSNLNSLVPEKEEVRFKSSMEDWEFFLEQHITPAKT